jgi:hypothetical protein
MCWSRPAASRLFATVPSEAPQRARLAIRPQHAAHLGEQRVEPVAGQRRDAGHAAEDRSQVFAEQVGARRQALDEQPVRVGRPRRGFGAQQRRGAAVVAALRQLGRDPAEVDRDQGVADIEEERVDGGEGIGLDGRHRPPLCCRAP